MVAPNDHTEASDARTAELDDRGTPVGEKPTDAPIGGRVVDIESASEPTVVPPPSARGEGDVAPKAARDRSLSPAGPISRYLLVLAVTGVAAAIYLTAQRPNPVAVLVTTRDLPAYHTITADDVTLSTRAADSGEKYAALPVEGRLSLKPIAKGHPLRQGDVAPDVARLLGDDLIVHGFAVPQAAAFGGALQAGDRIQLLLVRDGGLLARLDAVVLSVAGKDPEPTRTLVVALRAKDAKANEVAIGTGTAVVLKDPGAAGAPD